MSALAWATWASVAVLVLGSLGIFAWFLADVLRLVRRREGRFPPRGGADGSRSGREEGDPEG